MHPSNTPSQRVNFRGRDGGLSPVQTVPCAFSVFTPALKFSWDSSILCHRHRLSPFFVRSRLLYWSRSFLPSFHFHLSALSLFLSVCLSLGRSNSKTRFPIAISDGDFGYPRLRRWRRLSFGVSRKNSRAEMQSGGQFYGVPDIQQLMMERGGGPPRPFVIPPEMSVSQAMSKPRLQHYLLQQQQQQQLGMNHRYQQQPLHNQQQQQLCLGDDSSENHPSFVNRSAVVQERDPLTDEDGNGEGNGGTRNTSWPTEETLALLRIRSELDFNFRDSNVKGAPWEDVSRKLAEVGYHRSAKACKENFEHINKCYKKTKDGKNYRYFSELEAVYRGSCLNNGGAYLDAVEEEPLPPKPPRPPQQQQNKKKRKRKHQLASIKTFFESLVKRLMENQEALHNKFLEAIERRDLERLMREESWRKQEMARLAQENELRAQEHALASTREAAIVAFLQKITAQQLKIPQAEATSSRPSEMQEQLDRFMEKEFSDPNGKRWPKPEVHALIRLRSNLEPKFQEPGPKGPLWQEISAGMAALGFCNRSAKRCKEKWENINKYFRKTKDSMKNRPENAKTCPYFHQLDILYRKGVLSSPNKSNKSSDALPDNQAKEIDDRIQTLSDSENMIPLMPRETEEIPTNDSGTVYCFRSPDPVHPSQKTHALLKHILPEDNNHCSNQSNSGSSNVEQAAGANAFGDNISKTAKLERMMKGMLEAQQQQHRKLLDEFERREHEQADQDQDHELTDDDEISRQQNELKLIAQEHSQCLSQSALMALVDKLTAEIAGDYSSNSGPSAKR